MKPAKPQETTIRFSARLLRPKSVSENSKGACFRAKSRMARRDEGAYPQRSVTEEQRSQPALGAKTLRAAGLSAPAFVARSLQTTAGMLVARASAGAKIPRRRPLFNFQTRSKAPEKIGSGTLLALPRNASAKLPS